MFVSYIYTGCAAGRVVIYDLLTGNIVKVVFIGFNWTEKLEGADSPEYLR